jgi:hypothetical protein
MNEVEKGPHHIQSAEGERMTEAEWLNCRDLKAMRTFLDGKTSNRKLRLFACACCRTLDDVLIDPDICKALDAAERYADGRIADSTAMTWYKRACAARGRLPSNGSEKQWMAYHAVAMAVISNQYGAWADTHEAVAKAVVDGEGRRHGGQEWLAACAQAKQGLIGLLRDITGNPFRQPTISPAWLTWSEGLVTKLAEGIYLARAFDQLPILADALEDAGCNDEAILAHLRSGGPHVRGCWAVDVLLGRHGLPTG